jgi:hypothetical protein
VTRAGSFVKMTITGYELRIVKTCLHNPGGWFRQKTMLSEYFSHTGFVSIGLIPQGWEYNSQFFTETILPSIVEKLSVSRPKLKETAVNLHIDNVKPHNSRLSIQRIEEYGFIRVQKLPYSEAESWDFSLYFMWIVLSVGMLFSDVKISNFRAIDAIRAVVIAHWHQEFQTFWNDDTRIW